MVVSEVTFQSGHYGTADDAFISTHFIENEFCRFYESLHLVKLIAPKKASDLTSPASEDFPKNRANLNRTFLFQNGTVFQGAGHLDAIAFSV